MAVTGVLALAACGQDGEQAGSDEPTSTESPSGGTTDQDTSDSPEPSDDEKTSEVMTLTGTVSNGVEPGCLMLKSEGVKYQLVGDETKDLKEGAKITVTGKLLDSTVSTCMEGKPFEVESVESS